jgi:PAS domain S-box-containing protein
VPGAAPGSPGSVLLVDDNAEFRAVLDATIHRIFPTAEVGHASSGEEAIGQLLGRPWDVVLLDYRLPDIDGAEVLAEVRKRLLDVAVVVVTGEGDEKLAADIFRMGAYDYLVKGSIDAPQIRRCLEQVFLRRALERQIHRKSDALVASSRELSERTRALDVAYGKLREKKEQLRLLSDSLDAQVKQRTTELESTTAFLNEVLDSTTDHFIVATGAEGTVLTFNRGAEVAFGVASTEVVGRWHFQELFSDLRGHPDVLEELVAACRDQGSVQRELTGRTAQGRPFLAQITISRIGGRSGEAGSRGLVIVGTDVTHERELERQNQAYIRQIEMANVDLRRKNEQILEATRLKSEFLANVSHELRTPLNAIIGYSDLLLGEIYGQLQPRQSTAIQGIATRARDLLALINDILDLAKIEAGRMDLRIDRFPLAEVVEEVLETGRVLAVDKQVAVEWTVRDAGGQECRTDRLKLQQILLNLVNNAVKFTRQGFVRVETRSGSGGGELLISVVDSGIGIPAEQTETIFDEFRQVDGTSTRAYGGTGLGLAISRKFAQRLGGDLRVGRSVLGEGSTFLLTLPAVLPGGEEEEDGGLVSVSLRGEGEAEGGSEGPT